MVQPCERLVGEETDLFKYSLHVLRRSCRGEIICNWWVHFTECSNKRVVFCSIGPKPRGWQPVLLPRPFSFGWGEGKCFNPSKIWQYEEKQNDQLLHCSTDGPGGVSFPEKRYSHDVCCALLFKCHSSLASMMNSCFNHMNRWPSAGKVGDWKNHFTEAQNIEFDEVYEQKMKNCTLCFRDDL